MQKALDGAYARMMQQQLKEEEDEQEKEECSSYGVLGASVEVASARKRGGGKTRTEGNNAVDNPKQKEVDVRGTKGGKGVKKQKRV